jgi:hypothetical protein
MPRHSAQAAAGPVERSARRDKPIDAFAICRVGIDIRLFPRDACLSGDAWQAGRVLQRQAQHFSGECQGRHGRRRRDTVWSRTDGTEHRHSRANSLQAKGRIERAFGTLQDRLVKELRLVGISTVEAALARSQTTSTISSSFRRWNCVSRSPIRLCRTHPART